MTIAAIQPPVVTPGFSVAPVQPTAGANSFDAMLAAIAPAEPPVPTGATARTLPSLSATPDAVALPIESESGSADDPAVDDGDVGQPAAPLADGATPILVPVPPAPVQPAVGFHPVVHEADPARSGAAGGLNGMPGGASGLAFTISADRGADPAPDAPAEAATSVPRLSLDRPQPTDAYAEGTVAGGDEASASATPMFPAPRGSADETVVAAAPFMPPSNGAVRTQAESMGSADTSAAAVPFTYAAAAPSAYRSADPISAERGELVATTGLLTNLTGGGIVAAPVSHPASRAVNPAIDGGSPPATLQPMTVVPDAPNSFPVDLSNDVGLPDGGAAMAARPEDGPTAATPVSRIPASSVVAPSDPAPGEEAGAATFVSPAGGVPVGDASRPPRIVPLAAETPADASRFAISAPFLSVAPVPSAATTRTDGNVIVNPAGDGVEDDGVAVDPAPLAGTSIPLATASPTGAAPVPADPAVAASAPTAEAGIQHHLDVAHDGAWLDRLARDIALTADRDSHMRFQLNPERLGAMTVDIAQGADGATVRFTAESEAARQLIADAQPKLVAEARAQGMRIADTQVDLSGRDGGQGGAANPFAQQQHQQGGQRPPQFDRAGFERAGRTRGPVGVTTTRAPAAERYA